MNRRANNDDRAENIRQVDIPSFLRSRNHSVTDDKKGRQAPRHALDQNDLNIPTFIRQTVQSSSGTRIEMRSMDLKKADIQDDVPAFLRSERSKRESRTRWDDAKNK